MNFGYNPYYTPSFAPQMQRLQQMEQQYPQFAQQPPQSYPQNPQTYPQASLGLQGKLVDSIDVVRAIDIPLDGSTSYFALADGSAIVTKQLQKDGTSKTIIYKPSITSEDALQSNLNSSETNYIKEELKSIKSQIQAIANSLKGVDKNESNGNVTECNNE